jgi:hypothetical protein
VIPRAEALSHFLHSPGTCPCLALGMLCRDPSQWGGYPEDWEIARREWQGIPTLETLRSLSAWGRLA